MWKGSGTRDSWPSQSRLILGRWRATTDTQNMAPSTTSGNAWLVKAIMIGKNTAAIMEASETNPVERKTTSQMRRVKTKQAG